MNADTRLHHFNSIKVRLERQTSTWNSYQNGNFNSIKVRLELNGVIVFGVRWEFQFHKGAIRTETEYVSYEELYHFNSIKVRLEPPDEENRIISGQISIP